MSPRVLGVVALTLLFCAPAQAGSYEVKFCDGVSASGTPASPGNHAFVLTASAELLFDPIRCPTSGARDGGLTGRTKRDAGLAGPFHGAVATFTAPPGAMVRELRWRGVMYRSRCEWAVGVFTSAGLRAGLPANQDCGVLGIDYPVEFTWGIGAPYFQMSVGCGNVGGCSTEHDPASDYNGIRALMRTYSTRVTVDDATLPEFQNVRGGLTGGSWVRGPQSFELDAVDNVGIAETRFAVDGLPLSTSNRSCDYAFARPCPSPAVVDQHVNTTGLTDGEHRATVTAIDSAGNVATIERTFLSDNTAPARPEGIVLAGGDAWRTTNSFDLTWSNPGGQHAPIVAAHYSLCPASGESCSAGSYRGDGIASIAGLELPGPGQWVLRLWLEDAAGNVDDKAASDPVTLRFDDRPPSAAFEPVDPGDPLLVAVAVGDPHSGIAGGEVELQRVGRSEWRVLETALSEGRLTARIDDLSLPDGDYALRARVSDAAGNTTLTGQRADGSNAYVRLPLRRVTGVRAGVPKTVTPRRSRGRTQRATRLMQRARVRLWSHKVIHGQLRDREGQPLGAQTVQVHGRADLPGSAFEPLGTVTTSASGRFRYRADGARSRVLRFVYPGSPTVRPSATAVRLVVRAQSTFHASRRRTLNGGRVRFSGRLGGRPLPPGGKLVDLQAHYRGRWRTFANPRANADGRWSFRYRFGATVGRVVYPFRAVIPRQDLYPFAAGRSRIVKVVVTGR